MFRQSFRVLILLYVSDYLDIYPQYIEEYRKTFIKKCPTLTTDEGSHATEDYQEIGVRGLLSEPGVSDFTHGQGLFFFQKIQTIITTL